MSSDPINEAGLALIKRNEGCRLKTYLDSVSIPTIGYGHTGPEVHLGLVISQERADELLRQDLSKFEEGVIDALFDGVESPASDNQYAAMICLAYNIGLGNFAKSSVLRLHKQDRFALAADAFLMWNKAGGKVLAGLTRRRGEERALYLTPDE
jgi:lysozyme